MEYTLAGSGAEQALLAGLQFNLPPQSNYILSRRPSGCLLHERRLRLHT